MESLSDQINEARREADRHTREGDQERTRARACLAAAHALLNNVPNTRDEILLTAVEEWMGNAGMHLTNAQQSYHAMRRANERYNAVCKKERLGVLTQASNG